jgi:hypothetical protein
VCNLDASRVPTHEPVADLARRCLLLYACPNASCVAEMPAHELFDLARARVGKRIYELKVLVSRLDESARSCEALEGREPRLEPEAIDELDEPGVPKECDESEVE